ncbi:MULTISPECIES: recombinase family protein [unclassified Pseudomonas]|uniref:recombinase family protein n=1 Tax=unclassified Pseudomonas TaxID=196821 RepID=UPI000B80A1F3|nr:MULTISPECIES: recombinase family protein [unclassified Pseudomonas]NRH44059.1 recombinase family protein [Pseudomonas sp. MS15a(2019)]
MAIFGYGRVSTTAQTSENQRLELEQSGYALDFWFTDTVSGKACAALRPAFAELLSKIRDGETLIVSKLDRLGRDSVDVLQTVRLLEARRIRVLVHQLGAVDLTSPAGKLLISMLAAVAEMERDLLVERTQAGLTRAREAGKQLGRPPRLSQEQRSQVALGVGSGLSISALAKRYGVSRATIAKVIQN